MEKEFFPVRYTLRAVSFMLILILRTYQYAISPLFPRSCRFDPGCSNYAIGAIERHGPRRGVSLAVRRVLRCHPFHPGGYDPVP